MRDQDPLLLAAGQFADAGVGEAVRVDRLEHLPDERTAPARGKRHAEAVSVDPECDQVAPADRHV